MDKITVVGAGNVGATSAFFCALKELGDVVLLDIVEGLAAGKALDQSESAPVVGTDSSIAGGTDYELMKGSSIVIVTAGLARKPGMSRLDLLKKNAAIIGDVAEHIAEYAPESIVIMVTNPLDVMTYLMWQKTGFEPSRVIGQAGALDSARFKSFIAAELDVSVEDVQTMVLGGHGDTMVPMVRYTTVSGIPVSELMEQNRIEEIVERTRNGGSEIVGLLKTGSAFYAPAAAAVSMVEAVLHDKKRVIPSSCYLTGQYGLSDIYIGVPAKLGSSGVEDILELDLSEGEIDALQASAAVYREKLEKIKKN